KEVIPVYRRRRDVAYTATLKYLNEARVLKPIASMYLFPDIKPYLEKMKIDDLSFALKLAEEKGVVMLPGSVFGNSGKGHLRITFVTMNEADIIKGLELTRDFIDKYT
ncbi:MAG: aminotransferase class I/II-fold pyridoxal phosphate-dependent enzyme, partial [Desulfurococcaceae archaeon]